MRKSKAWPLSARALSERVRRAATFLRNVGIDIAFEREGRARIRTIRITRKPERAPAEASTPSTPSPEAAGNKGFDQGKLRTQAPGVPSPSPSTATNRKTTRLRLRAVLRPTVQAAVAVASYGKAHGDCDLMALVDVLGDQVPAAICFAPPPEARAVFEAIREF